MVPAAVPASGWLQAFSGRPRIWRQGSDACRRPAAGAPTAVSYSASDISACSNADDVVSPLKSSLPDS